MSSKLYTQKDIENLLKHTSRRFCVRYALLVCNDIRHLITHKDSINALQVTQDWLDYKATDEQVYEAATSANAAASSAAYYAIYAYYAYYAYATAYYAAASSAAYYAAASEYVAKEHDIKIDYYYKLCISIMSPLERELFLNTGDNENE